MTKDIVAKIIFYDTNGTSGIEVAIPIPVLADALNIAMNGLYDRQRDVKKDLGLIYLDDKEGRVAAFERLMDNYDDADNKIEVLDNVSKLLKESLK